MDTPVMTFQALGGGEIAIRLTLQSTPELVSRALRDIRGAIDSTYDFPCYSGDWEIILAEVLNNVVKHAYAQRPDGEIRLNLRFAQDGLSADVVDFGAPMPDNELPPGAPHDLDVPMEDLPEGGFGWFMIRTMTTELAYRRCGGCNCLHFEMPLSQQA